MRAIEPSYNIENMELLEEKTDTKKTSYDLTVVVKNIIDVRSVYILILGNL